MSEQMPIPEEVPRDEDIFEKFISDNDMMVHWVEVKEDGSVEAEVRINLYSKKLNLSFSVVELITWRPDEVTKWG